jgi:hypothetical protein
MDAHPAAATAPVRSVNWRLGMYLGAVLGGLGWGVVALLTIGAPGDQAQHDAVDGTRLLIAAVVCIACAAAGGCLLAFGSLRTLRGVGLALLVGPMGGWLIVASLAVQRYAIGWI